jgi:PAP2 superfamily
MGGIRTATATRWPAGPAPAGVRNFMRIPAAWRELLLVGGGLLVYFLIRASNGDQTILALQHAQNVVGFERTHGFYWEGRLQRHLATSGPAIQVWNGIYFWGHAPVIVAIAVWLFMRHRPLYRLLRNAFLLSAATALLVYKLYPLAPPRLLPGFTDTMQQYSTLSYQSESLKPFVNAYAAIPSLHVGWAFLIGLGVVLGSRQPLLRTLGAALPAVMFLAVIATANHYLVDGLVGLALCQVSLLVVLLLRHWRARTRPILGSMERSLRLERGLDPATAPRSSAWRGRPE